MTVIELFLDIDGCLINKNYDFTVPLTTLGEAAKKLEDRVRINLNSNRSLQSILKIWNQTKFNGLLIYENGSGIYNPSSNEDTYFDQPELDREKLIASLSDISNDFEFIPTDNLVRDPKNFSSDSLNKIYFEETRKFTMTIYPRVFKDKIPFTDQEYLLKVKNRLDAVYGQNYDTRISESYGNIILVPKNALKSNPMKRISCGLKIASFGDEAADICMFKESDYGLIGCPNNSQETAKEFVLSKGGFISKKDYTSAVIDFLEYLNFYLSGGKNNGKDNN